MRKKGEEERDGKRGRRGVEEERGGGEGGKEREGRRGRRGVEEEGEGEVDEG